MHNLRTLIIVLVVISASVHAGEPATSKVATAEFKRKEWQPEVVATLDRRDVLKGVVVLIEGVRYGFACNHGERALSERIIVPGFAGHHQ
jgi:hypothetical protein